MKITIYGLRDRLERQAIYQIVQSLSLDFEDVKVVCVDSNKGNLKGLEVYQKGSKAVKVYVDLLNQKAVYLKRRMVVKKCPLKV